MKKGIHSGFTLMEVLLVVTIIVVLAGSGVAAYYRFTQRQAAVDDARNFATELRKVQALARNMVYPAGCTSGLSEYIFTPDCSGEDCQTATVTCMCGGSTYIIEENTKVLIKAYFATNTAIHFDVGSGQISPTGTYDLSSEGDVYKINVVTDVNGLINVEEVKQ